MQANREPSPLSGVIAFPGTEALTAHRAVSGILAGHQDAPELLAGARTAVAKRVRSLAAVGPWRRIVRVAEQALSRDHKETDPEGRRHLRFFVGAGVATLMSLGCGAVTLLLALGVPVPELVAVSLSISIMAGGWAWKMALCKRDHKAVGGFVAAGVLLYAALSGLSVGTNGAGLLRLGELAGCIALTCGAVALSTWVLERTEAYSLGPKRRALRNARRELASAEARVERDQELAHTACGTWESLVIEEVTLEVSSDEAFLDECRTYARHLAESLA